MRGSASRWLVLWLTLVIAASVGVWFWVSSSASTSSTEAAPSYDAIVPAAATIRDAPTPTATPDTDQTGTEGGTSVTTAVREAPVGDAALVDATWVRAMAGRVGIPRRALLGYAGATVALQRAQPRCHLDWTTLAALGNIESGHGTTGGGSLDSAGVATPAIQGPGLSDGTRAQGPLQFIPSTWARWGSDGNGDGRRDPQQIDDAALTTGRYLCSYGDLSSAATWRKAIFGYNHLDSYVASVVAGATRYAQLSRSGS